MIDLLLPTVNDNRQHLVNAVLDGMTSQHSKRAYQRHLTDFLLWHNEQGQPPLTKAVVTRYRTDLESAGRGASSINQALSAIRKLVREASDNGVVDLAIAQGIANIKGIKTETLPAGRNISPGELAALMLACTTDSSPAGARDAALIAALYTAGLRRGEIVAINVENFDPETGELKILHAKGRKQRIAHITNGAKAAIADWLAIRGNKPGPLFVQIRRGGHIKRNRLTTQAVYAILQSRAKIAKVETISPHDFRRTFVGDLLDAGADIATVQKMAGHADVSTTARYDRRGEEVKRKAAGLLHIPYTRPRSTQPGNEM